MADRVSRVKNENYIVEHGWMINELDLKGNELRIYAIIYGFSQAENQAYTGSLQYLADWINGTRQTALNCLQSLVKKGLLDKIDKEINGVKFCEYRCKSLNWCSKNLNGGCSKNLNGGSQNILPNNLEDNPISNKDSNRESEAASGETHETPRAPGSKRFKAPTVEEVRAYCEERGNGVDAQRFVDYYEAAGWKRGKTPIKDWRACVRTWERSESPRGQRRTARQHDERSRIKTEAEHAAGGHESGFGW